MEKKLSVAEFATLVGTSSKTIYERIKRNSELPLNEQLITVDEKIKGRSVTLIATNTQQIDVYKKIYGKEPVINGEYYEILTDNEGNKPLIKDNKPIKNNDNNKNDNEVVDRLLTLNEENNNRILQLMNELITAKQNQLLLEDKASREGLYLNEINELKSQLKTDNKRYKLVINSLLTLLITLIMIIICFITFYLTQNSLEKVQDPPQNSFKKVQDFTQ